MSDSPYFRYFRLPGVRSLAAGPYFPNRAMSGISNKAAMAVSPELVTLRTSIFSILVVHDWPQVATICQSIGQNSYLSSPRPNSF